MRFEESLRLTLTNIIQNKFKVLLTSLGIIIGTMTIILVIAIGRGGEEQIASQFSSLSAESIYINPDYSGGNLELNAIPPILPQHLEQILAENPYIAGIYLRASTYREMQIGAEKEFLSLVGMTAGYAKISNLSFAAGRDFAEGEMGAGDSVCALGYTVANKHFGSPEAAVGQYIKVGNRRLKVVGVLGRKAEGLQGFSPDNSVIIPYETAIRHDLLDEYAIPQVVGLATDLEHMEQAKERILSTLDYLLGSASSYTVEDAGSRIEAATESARTMRLLLTSVAAIVFLVGGIGIMNVLFVSVKERTKEIGILKALGTRRRDILLQFMLESLGMGMFGGLIGCGLGLGLLPLMRYSEMPVATSLGGPLLAMTFAVVTAAVFGFYPAHKASVLKPIDALNQE